MRVLPLILLAGCVATGDPVQVDDGRGDTAPTELRCTGCTELFRDRDLSGIVPLARDPTSIEFTPIDPLTDRGTRLVQLKRYANVGNQIHLTTHTSSWIAGIRITMDPPPPEWNRVGEGAPPLEPLDVICVVDGTYLRNPGSGQIPHGSCVQVTEPRATLEIPRDTEGWWWYPTHVLLTSKRNLDAGARAAQLVQSEAREVTVTAYRDRVQPQRLLAEAQDLTGLFYQATERDGLYASQPARPIPLGYSLEMMGTLLGSKSNDELDAPSSFVGDYGSLALRYDLEDLTRFDASILKVTTNSVVPLVACLVGGSADGHRQGVCLDQEYEYSLTIPGRDADWTWVDQLVVTTDNNWKAYLDDKTSAESQDIDVTAAAYYWKR